MTAYNAGEQLRRYFNDVSTEEEKDMLMSFLAENKNAVQVQTIMEEVWSEFAFIEPIFKTDASELLFQNILLKERALVSTSLKPQIDSNAVPATHRIHFLKTSWFRYAAAIVIILGIGSYLWFNNTTSNPVNQKNLLNPSSDNHDKAILTLANGQQIILESNKGNIVKQGNLTVVNLPGKLNYEGVGDEVEFHTLSTPKGGQYQLVLPDGSKVWLNAASSITYPTAFTAKDRTVSISGEAYFEVATDKSKVFHVKTPKEEITVLGTQFNVNAYNDDKISKTSLLEGAIKIDNFILQPGQAYTNGKVIMTNVEQDIAWKEGFFNLQDASLEEVMKQLERWYDIQVKYEGKMPAIKFKGKMDRGLQLSGVLRLLSELGIKSKVEGKTLIVGEK